MTAWLPGMKITAARLNDFTATTTTSGLTAATGWSVSSFQGRKVSGITFVEMFVTRTGANITEVASNTGNISPDVDMCTLPAGWCPQETINATYGNGTVDGECTISTAGVVTIRSISGSGSSGSGISGTAGSGASNVRVTAVWVSENN